MKRPDREQLKQTFGEAADLYDTARPEYPDELFSDLVELAELREGSRILEVGCGTGKATLPFALRGFRITGLELAPSLAAIARSKLADLPNAEIVTTPFEDWDSQGKTFDLVFAATAWHWIDPQIRYRKAAGVLSPGSALAFFSATHAFPPDADSFFFEIQETYEAIGETIPDEKWPPPLPEDVPDSTAEIVSTGLFDQVRLRRYVWEQSYGADDYIALLNTFSGHIAMAPNKRDLLYSEVRKRISARPSGRVRRHWLAILHVARRL